MIYLAYISTCLHIQRLWPLFLCCGAGTVVWMQVQLVNLGNTILRDVDVAVPEVSDLVCWGGLTSLDDAALDVAFLTNDTVAPGTKVVCNASCNFNQTELDKPQASKAFTPALTTTTAPAAVMDNAGLAAGYTASATVSINAVPMLYVAVNATACDIPYIIPADATSK